ncbi:hypothetical protein [Ciceribacter selenitireducens]
MPKKNVEVAIGVGGIAKSLLKAQLSKRDDLYIFLRHAEFFENIDGPVTSLQKYSVHPSLKMPEHNLIKQKISTGNGEGSTVHFTRALKVHNNFAELYTRCAPSLAPDRYNVSGPDVIQIGNYNPEKATLIYSVCVSRAERQLRLPYSESRSKRLASFPIGPYRVSILFTFCLLPSPRQGWLVHNTTVDTRDMADLEIKALLDGFQEGMSDSAAAAMIGLPPLLINLRKFAIDEAPAFAPLVGIATICREGIRGSKAYKKMVREAGKKGIFDDTRR